MVFLVIFISACSQTTSPQPPATAFQPAAWLSGQPGAVNLTPAEGNGPFQCNITAGALPQGFNLNNCVISGTAPMLAGGTTKSVSPAFTIAITNGAGQQQTLEYNILTMASLPAIIFNEPGTCIVKQKCNFNLIAQVNGGTPPYHFQSDTFRNGAPPMGMIIDVNGVLTGTSSKTGQYTFGVCVVDVVAASKCGQTSVFVIDEEEAEEIISYSESSGLCSSNADCTGFASNNCDAPENVRCSSNGLCHCCLTLCPGGENCKCIGCSTGCGGGTYCEGDVCVFDAGRSPDGEQMAESGVAAPEEETKTITETWSGSLAGTDDIKAHCVEGSFSYNFNINFDFKGSLANAVNSCYDDCSGAGTISGTAGISNQVQTSKYYPDCRLVEGSVSDSITISARGGITIRSEASELIPGYLQFDANTKDNAAYGPLILTVEGADSSAISGTWGTGQFGDYGPHGTFTLTKQ